MPIPRRSRRSLAPRRAAWCLVGLLAYLFLPLTQAVHVALHNDDAPQRQAASSCCSPAGEQPPQDPANDHAPAPHDPRCPVCTLAAYVGSSGGLPASTAGPHLASHATSAIKPPAFRAPDLRHTGAVRARAPPAS